MLACLVLLCLTAVHGSAQGTSTNTPPIPAEQQGSAQELSQSQIAEVNALARPGKPSFHLKMSFQVFDFHGKPSEAGNLEEWWGGPSGMHLVVTAPSLTTGDARGTDTDSGFRARRTRYLAQQLLDLTLAPAAEFQSSAIATENEERVFGTTVLECRHTVPDKGTRAGGSAQFEECSDPGTGTVRVIKGYGYSAVRNSPGRFGRTFVALSTTIDWGGIPAIEGRVDKLEAFDPQKTTVPLEKPDESPFAQPGAGGEIRLPSGVVAGHKISGATPIYPVEARERRISGSVTLQAVISKQGKIDLLFPMASSDPLLTDAALAAVSNWTYTPYLLNGTPTEVNTTITVTFSLNRL